MVVFSLRFVIVSNKLIDSFVPLSQNFTTFLSTDILYLVYILDIQRSGYGGVRLFAFERFSDSHYSDVL